MSRVLPPIYAQLVQSIDLTFELFGGLDETPRAKVWTTVYPALFKLLEKFFCNVHSLRVTIRLPAWERVKHTMSDSKITEVVAPWEGLAKSRDWKILEFCVPSDWRPVLADRAETQSIWELTVTCWYERTIWGGCGSPAQS